MKAPEKIYLPNDIDWPSAAILTLGKQPGDAEYIRKDLVDEKLKTAEETIQLAEDHAYFAGKEKLREELLEWANAKKAELLDDEEITDVAVGINMGMDMLISKLNSL